MTRYDSKFAPLPRGARDLLPATCRRWRQLGAQLLDRFEAWGYQQVRPPAIEYFEVLGRGLDGDAKERCIRFTESASGRLVTLRSDVTPQIARMVAQRVGGTLEVGDQLRLSYQADPVAAPTNSMERAEHHQVGVELLGEIAPHGDAELIALADESLRAVGLTSHRFDLGETGVARAVLDRLPEAAREDARRGLARKDPEALAALVGEVVSGGGETLPLVELARLYGAPEPTLARASRVLVGLGLESELARLGEVLRVLGTLAPSTLDRVELDLGEARGHEYYTGLRLRVWAPGAGEPVVRGGRYDDLLGRFGASMPASGFALDLDALELALVAENATVDLELAPATVFAIERAVADPQRRAQAASGAAERRAAGERAWTEASDTLERAMARAAHTGASHLVWLDAAGRRNFTWDADGWREGRANA